MMSCSVTGETNRSPKTLYADIKRGKVSAVTDSVTGKKEIDIAELRRAFGEIELEKPVSNDISDNDITSQVKTALEIAEKDRRIAVLETKLVSLKDRLQTKQIQPKSALCEPSLASLSVSEPDLR